MPSRDDDALGSVADAEVATALLDAMTDATAVLSPQGVIVAVNRAWRSFCLDNGGDPESVGIGVNYLDVCERAAATGSADAQQALAGLRAVLAGKAVERTLDYPCSSPTVARWFMLRVTPVQHRGLGALVSHTNITRRKRAEQGVTEVVSLDPLARLCDREQLAGWLGGAPAGGRAETLAPGEVGVLYLHLHGIESVADAFGETARDEALQTVARRLTAVTRPGDGVARLGDHDFAVAAPGMTATGLTALLARVRHALSEALSIHGEAVELGATIGTYLAAHGEDLTDCLRLADETGYPIRRPRPPRDGAAPATHEARDDEHRRAGSHGEPPRGTVAAHPDTTGNRRPDGAEAPDGARGSGGSPRPGQTVGADQRMHELSVALEHALAERTTELQQRTGELTAARKELEDFAYSVSHDLRAPLRAMSGFARILVEDHAAALAAEAQHCVERIQASADEMGNQIDGLLTISRLQRGRVTHDDLDMSAAVRRAWEQVRPGDRPVRFHLGGLPGARGDRDLIGQLLVHLLDNAVKFTAHVDEPLIEVSADSVEGSVTYVVKDNGVGFDMRCAKRLFTPFQRLHPSNEYPGIGIGLAAALQIVRRHGGTIDAHSAPNQGACFRFTLGTAAAANAFETVDATEAAAR